MGALMSNHKRSDEFFNLSSRHPHINSPDFQSFKRLRFSPMNQVQDRLQTSKSTLSRVSRYPESTPSIRRQVHAPVKPQRFSDPSTALSRVYRATSGIELFEKEEDTAMGTLLSRFDKTRKEAFGSFRFFTKPKEEIDLVEERQKGVVSEDSSIEEVGAPSESDTLEVVNVSNLQESVISELSNGYAMGVENAGKVFPLMSVDRDDEVEVLSKSAYKKLLQETNRRDSKLGEIAFNIRLNEEKWSALQLMRPAKKAEEVPREPFVPLTDEEEAEVKFALAGNRRRVLVVHENSNIEITGEVLQCLRPGAWLNDEVINLYMELLKEREKREPKKFLSCHFFNTFFYKKLIGGKDGYDYKSVRRWTTQRKLGYSLIDCDKIFVPIHKEIHWVLAIINKKDKKFQYLDSLGGNDSDVLRILARYLVDEVKDKNGKDIDVESWQQEYVQDLPEQENGYDCGVFMIKYADFYSRGLGLCFKQEHMPYFRRRTMKEIMKLRAD